MTPTDYDTFIKSKLAIVAPVGFDHHGPLNRHLFPWQNQLVSWALRTGRAALFEECGLGKTLQQLAWADEIVRLTGKDVLILCPLAVAHQTHQEGVRFSINSKIVGCADDVAGGINICNYDKLHKLDPGAFVGVVLDESSILKSFTGKLRKAITDAFQATPYKLCCSATPAPNDFTELGQHAEFLGVCSHVQMLATYFINDTFDTGDWRLKKHAVSEFWRWVSAWAACVQLPSDIGGDDTGFELPPCNIKFHNVSTEIVPDLLSGELIPNPTMSSTAMHAHNRRTADDRVAEAASIANSIKGQCVVWCESNDESEALASTIHGSVEVAGHHSSDTKEERLNAFADGAARVIVTKPSICGWGLNWQFCCEDVFVGLSHSFEKFYQAGKRIHRFGQTKPVTHHIVQTDHERAVFANLMVKQEKHDTMRELVKFTAENIGVQRTSLPMKTNIESIVTPEWTAYHGDCVRVASTLPDESIGLSIFSPPFADLFTYSSDPQDMGNCADVDAFMVQFDFLVEQLTRVTIPGRECCVHCVDLMTTKWKTGSIQLSRFADKITDAFQRRGWLFHSRITVWKSPVTEMQRTKAHGLLYKTLRTDSADSRVGVPDYLLVFRKPGENPVPITHTPDSLPLSLWQEIASPVWMTVNQSRVLNGEVARDQEDERHICPLQLDVIDRALLMWSTKGDTVFSPFMGIGSEGYCSVKMGRKFIGAELKKSYFDQSCVNLTNAVEDSRTLFNL